jgi:hypothetical protein
LGGNNYRAVIDAGSYIKPQAVRSAGRRDDRIDWTALMLENGETAPRGEGDAFHHPAMKMTCVMPAREPKELPAGLGVAAEPLAIEIRQEQKAIGSRRGGFGHFDDGGVVDLVVVAARAEDGKRTPRAIGCPHVRYDGILQRLQTVGRD